VGGCRDHERAEIDAGEMCAAHSPREFPQATISGREPHATEVAAAGRRSTTLSAPVVAFQTLTVWSSPAETIQAPSGLIAQAFTATGGRQ